MVDPWSNQGMYGQYDQMYGYDPYGYGYAEEFVEREMPKPDPSWIDPAKINWEYLKKIQKETVQEEFNSLKEERLYLIEVSIQSIDLKNELAEKPDSPDKTKDKCMFFLKLFELPFMDVGSVESSDEIFESSNISLTKVMFSGLFQEIYTYLDRKRETKLNSSEKGEAMKKNINDAEKSEEKKTVVKESSDMSKKTKELKAEEQKKDTFTLPVNKGKSVLVIRNGIAMIKMLLQNDIKMRVTRYEITEELKKVETESLGYLSIRVPQQFHDQVLIDSRANSILPSFTTTTASHPLVDLEGQEVGHVHMTVSLTCLAKAVVNSIWVIKDDIHRYRHTTVMCSVEGKQQTKTDKPINPRLALRNMQQQILPVFKTSTEILRNCFESNLVDCDDIKTILGESNCYWLEMAKNSLPEPPTQPSYTSLLQIKADEEKRALWFKLNRICRDHKTQEAIVKKRSIYERLEELRMPFDADSSKAEKELLKDGITSPDKLSVSSGKSRQS